MNRSELRGYLPLRDYALIGDCHGSALVSNKGSIDWCCLKRFDADPVFSRVLDAEQGAYFEITPAEPFQSSFSYIRNTNILKTRFKTDSGVFTVTDFMPVARANTASTYDYVNLQSPNWLVRRVEVQEGEVDIEVNYRLSEGLKMEEVPLARRTGLITSPKGPFLYSSDLECFEIQGGHAKASRNLKKGDHTLTFVLTGSPALNVDPVASAQALQNTTLAFWSEWTNFCTYFGRYKEQVTRSSLVLKMLTYAPTGAISAAATTSLPEEIGGERNFDYRFCWIRDASFTLFALSSIGYSGEAQKFTSYVESCFRLTYPNLQIVYGLGGETDLVEREHPHVHGYRGSRPVRTGNHAYKQAQLDIFGELQETFEIFTRLGGSLDESETKLVREIADAAVENWKNKDHGIWEMRSEAMNHVYSKILCWVAVDRASKMVGAKGHRYAKVAQEILEDIKANGINEDDSLKMAYENSHADASLLRALLVGIPLDEKVMRATVEKVEERLSHSGLLYRYKRGDDGFSGHDGAFLACSFWLVSALLQIGEYDRACKKFDELLDLGNDVGLYSEEIDPESSEFLGNYPQALTHLALIESAVNIDIYEKQGLKGLKGSLAERASHSAGATMGWKGLWASFRRTGRVARVFSSQKSKFGGHMTALNR